MQRRTEQRNRRFPGSLGIPLALCLLAPHCGTPPEERRLSIYAMKQEPTESHIDEIRALVADEDRDVRATAVSALVGLRVDDSAALALAALADPDGFVRATAAKLLGDLGDPRHVEALARVLAADLDPVARQRAAESLERLGDAQAVRGLIPGLGDPMERVRMAAVHAVSRLDPLAALPELEGLLRGDIVWEIRAEAAHALGLTGSPEVVPALEAALEDPNEFVRAAAANALRLHEDVRELSPGE